MKATKKCKKHLFSMHEYEQYLAMLRSNDLESKQLGLNMIFTSKTFMHYMGTERKIYSNAIKCLRKYTRDLVKNT